jgi:tetratricopeptide (TPR) repeat protein
MGRSDPDAVPRAYVGRGNVWWKKKDYARAFADYQAAVRQADSAGATSWTLPSHLHLAAAYTFCPDAKLRDPAKAVALARKACEALQYEDGDYIQILAALHAHTGDFEAAIRWQTRAVRLLSLEELKKRLAEVDPDPEDIPVEEIWDAESQQLEQAAKRRLEQYRQGRTVWDFDRELTGPADPRSTKGEQ